MYKNMDVAVDMFHGDVGRIGIVIDSDMDGACSAAIAYMLCKEYHPNVEPIIFVHTGKQHGCTDLLPDILAANIDMLKPKMKNSNVWNHGYRVAAYNDGYHLVREENDVINAIALAYRSGYLRAKKDRPFKIGGEKE